MKISFLFLVLFLWVNKAIFAQTSTENYVLSRTYKNKGMSVEYTFPGTPATFRGIPSTVQTGITYLDGLGKTKLEVAAFTSPNQKDILVQTEYDALHRPVKNYLPIASGEGNGKIRTGIDYSYYNGSTICTPTPNAYLKIGYEESPLSRVNQQIAPGVSINDASGVRTGYKINSDADKVYQYQMNDSDDGIAASPGFYAANTLNVIESKDEDNKLVKEYRDRYGRVVLKRVEKATNDYLDTYYVYDQKGQLRFVLQPNYQGSTDSDKLGKYAFQYTYDNQGRMTSKRVPGTDAATTMSYYDNDLLKESTDAKGQTFKYIYDELNRPKKTLLGNSELVETYYDSYSFIPGPDPSSLKFINELGLGATDFVYDPKENSRKGMATGSRVRILNANGSLSDTWLYSATYYDNKYRVIQTVRELYGLGSGAYERVSYKRDFTGKVLVERITQSTSANLYTLEKKYAYDHADRLTYVTHKVMEGSEVKKEYNHFTLTYNEIGQLTQKSLHGGVQGLTYRYTPRGWVCSIGNSGGNTFNVGLAYNSNGNINNLSWQTPTSGTSKSFSGISYDGANRLTAATGSPYEEKNISYDRNGNILTLQRSKDGAMIDNLSYDAFEGNRLLRVQDQSGNTEGFKDNSNAGNDYAYDANGNLTQDQNKGISAVAYNLLNLTGQVTINGQTVSYIYDAAGNKHQMQAATSSGSITTNYEGIFEYTTKIENSTTTNTMRIGLEEGQLIRDGDNYTVNYYLKDHLGNVRTVIDETGAVLQETDYYPFGLPVVRGGGANNKYLYNGKEKQPETEWLDYGARMYMSDISRWGGIDPLADEPEQIDKTPFAYGFNNPIRYNDPDGRCPTCSQGEQAQRDYAIGATVTNPEGGSWTWTGKNWITTPQQASISTTNADFFDNWRNSGNFVSQVSYSFADGLYGLGQIVTGQGLQNHLGGQGFDSYHDKIGTGIVGLLTVSGGLFNQTNAAVNISGLEATKRVASGQLGKIIGWGEGQGIDAIKQTINVTENLTKSQVQGWAKQGLTKSWVQDQLGKYSSSLAKGGDKLKNTQLMHRKELMEKILKLWD